MFFLGFRRRQASPISFSDHQASPWSSRTLLAHQVSSVTISASSRTVSALQAPLVTISTSPRPLGFLAFTISASPRITRLGGSWLLLQHRQTSISASRHLLLLRQLLVALGPFANSGSLPRFVGLAPPVGLGCSSSTARPRRCLSPFSGSRPSQLVWVSCFSHLFAPSLQIFFYCWLR